MRIIGIDPGKKGAIVILDGSNVILHQMPEDANTIVNILSDYVSDSHVFLEKSQAMPGQGVSSMFNYGTGFGTLLGILAALKIPHTLVHPKTWCKVMHAGTADAEAKVRSLEAARRLFPSVQFVRPRCTKPDEGYIDAILIAEYGRRCLKG